MKQGRIFIDGSNVYFDWNKVNPGTQLDIEKYIELVKGKYPNVDFIRTYYFTSQTTTNTFFLQQINKLPYVEVKTGRLQNKTIVMANYSIVCKSCGTAVTKTITTQTLK